MSRPSEAGAKGTQSQAGERGFKVCESLVKRCPYCGRTHIRLTVGAMVGRWHQVLCRNCGGIFGVPCED